MSVNIRDLMSDPHLFGDHFSGSSWDAWRTLLTGFYGLPLAADELVTWQQLTQQQEAPQQAHDELWLVVGRRGGKTQAAALLAVFEAIFNDFTPMLSPGEVATVAVVAADKKQARSAFRYISGLLNSNPMMKALVLSEDKESITLNNRVVIEVTAASFRSSRGYSFGCVINDELAFWRSENSANPDFEILNAMRPGLATLGGKMICLSSPYAKTGALYDAFRRYYGKPGDVLVAKAPTLTMNPSLPAKVVERALERDPAAASAEYLAEFRSDIDSVISREELDAVTRSSPLTLPPVTGTRYSAFTDPTGGGKDEFTLAVGHAQRGTGLFVVDLVAGRKGTPAEIVADYARLLKQYGVTRVNADRYAGSWPSDEFGKHGITVIPSEQPRTGLYLDCLAAIRSGQVELPPDEQMILQFQQLERRTSAGGKENIDHRPGAHDDRSNAAAGLIAHNRKSRFIDYSKLL